MLELIHTNKLFPVYSLAHFCVSKKQIDDYMHVTLCYMENFSTVHSQNTLFLFYLWFSNERIHDSGAIILCITSITRLLHYYKMPVLCLLFYFVIGCI